MKYVIIIALLLCSFTAFSQVQKGTLVIGGGLNLSRNSDKREDSGTSDTKSNQGQFGLSGSYEKFINDRTAFGLFLGYNYSSFEAEHNFGMGMDTYGFGEHLVTAGPQLSKYIPIRNKLYFTVLSRASLGIGMMKSRNNDEKYNVWSVGINASPGLAFFLNDNLALNAGIGNLYYSYKSQKAREENRYGMITKESAHDYGLSFNVNTFTFGLKYFLRTAISE